MALTPLSEILASARAGGYAVGYFEAWDTYSLEAVAEAAEAERSPVVLGFGGMTMDPDWLDQFGIEPFGAYGRAVAERLDVPAALILNEVPEWEHACRGVKAGFDVVMLDTSDQPFRENVEATKKLVDLAHPRGVEIQAELGRLPDFSEGARRLCRSCTPARTEMGELNSPARSGGRQGKGGAVQLPPFSRVRESNSRTSEVPAELGRLPDFGDHDPGELTDPGQAREFVAATGVDFLAVSVGNVHMRPDGEGSVDLARLRSIREQVEVPLVIHGGSGLSAEAAGALIAEGITLFHVGTIMKKRFHEAVLADAAPGSDHQAIVGSRKGTDFLMPGKAAVVETVRSRMRLYGSSGRAD